MPYTPTPKRPRKSIKLDRVQAADFIHRNITYCCEQCSHYDPDTETCTIGYNPKIHNKEIQLKRFYLNGHMAFCRFSEID